MKRKNSVDFLTGSFLITNSLNIENYLLIYLVKRDYAVLQTYFLFLGLFCSIYAKGTNVFYIYQEDFEVLKLLYFKLMYVAIVIGVFGTY